MMKDNPEKIRLFIGSYPDKPVISEDKLTELSNLFGFPVRFTPKEKLHLTWKFIGEIPDSKLSEVQEITEESVQKISEINISFDKFELWPNKRNPSLLVLCGSDLTGNATTFHNKLDKNLEKIGVKRENRKFKPHLTVARFKLKQKPEETISIPEELIPDSDIAGFSSVSIIKSTLAPKGSIYEVLKNYSAT